MARRGTSADPTYDEDDSLERRHADRADQRTFAEMVDDENDEAQRRGFKQGFDARRSVQRGSGKLRPPSGVDRLGDSRAPTDTPAPAKALGSGTRGATPIFAPLLVELALITTRSIIRSHRAPLPSELGSAVFIFGLLSLPSGEWGDVAAVTAWGLVLSTLYGTIAADPGLPGKVGNAVSGSSAPPVHAARGTAGNPAVGATKGAKSPAIVKRF